jgi:hypothetical protein
MQPHHQRHEVVPTRLGAGDQPPQIVARVHDIRIGQQQIIGLLGGGGRGALAHRPQLAGPSRRHRRRLDHRHAVAGADRRCRDTGDLRGAVAAVIVDDDQLEAPRIVLGEQRGDRGADHICLVARRNDRDDRPGWRRRRLGLFMWCDPPEHTAKRQQIKPSGRRDQADGDDCVLNHTVPKNFRRRRPVAATG